MDRDVSVTGVAAIALWVAGGVLVAVGFAFELRYMGAGLWLSGLGGVSSIRLWFCQQRAAERNAFILGREVGEESIRPLR